MNSVVFSCPELVLRLGLKMGGSRQEIKGKGRTSVGNGIAGREEEPEAFVLCHLRFLLHSQTR